MTDKQVKVSNWQTTDQALTYISEKNLNDAPKRTQSFSLFKQKKFVKMEC